MNSLKAAAAIGMVGVLAASCAVTDRIGLTNCGGAAGRAAMASNPACATDLSFPIYFPDNSDLLTPAAMTSLQGAVAQARACTVAGVSVTGLASASGDAQTNLELSAKRAAAVTAALTAQGITAPLEVRALGAATAVTAGGQLEPMQRRTEVTIHYRR